MSTEAKALDWKAIPFGPWERHSRDLDGGRRVIVANGPLGGWVWDMWSMLDFPDFLVSSGSDFPAVREAMADAERAAATFAAIADDELRASIWGGADVYVGVDALKIVTLEKVTGCVMCRNDVAPGLAAEGDGGRALWCGSCASRNPGAVLDSETEDEVPSARQGSGSYLDDPALDEWLAA
jgi:hypothetical protein